MTFVLDTNIVSNFRKKRPHPGLIRWVEETGPQELQTTVVTVTEIQCGIERARVTNPAASARIEEWLEAILSAGEPAILPMGVGAARLLARMYETPALRHFITTNPGAREAASGADLAIAAIAIASDAIVATENVKDFLMIHAAFPLPGLFNPFDATWHARPA